MARKPKALAGPDKDRPLNSLHASVIQSERESADAKGERAMEDERRYAFPEALLLRRKPNGGSLVLGIRYKWNTGETQIAWCRDDRPDPGDLDEKPIQRTVPPR